MTYSYVTKRTVCMGGFLESQTVALAMWVKVPFGSKVELTEVY